MCSPRAHNGLSHVAHVGRSSGERSLQSSLCPMPTRSSSSCARNRWICSSTAASISAHIALGCSLRHWVIPSTSRRPALTRRICSLRALLFFLAFLLSFLSSCFPCRLPPPASVQKKNRTQSYEGRFFFCIKSKILLALFIIARLLKVKLSYYTSDRAFRSIRHQQVSILCAFLH